MTWYYCKSLNSHPVISSMAAFLLKLNVVVVLRHVTTHYSTDYLSLRLVGVVEAGVL